MEKSGSYDPRAIANKLLYIAGNKNISITVMQLVKLVYYAHGWCLALLDKPLSKHQAQAWQYGPVFPRVYSAFKNYGGRPIINYAIDPATDKIFMADFQNDEIEIMEEVVERYGRLHAFALSNLTHQTGSPWQIIHDEKGVYETIPDDVIKAYFRERAGINAT